MELFPPLKRVLSLLCTDSISPGYPQLGFHEDSHHLNTWLPCVCLCTAKHSHFPVKWGTQGDTDDLGDV